MIDREKVIRAIEYCTDNVFICHGDDCPYWQDGLRTAVCWDNVMKDALELLKADEYYEQALNAMNKVDEVCKSCQEFTCDDCKIREEKKRFFNRTWMEME